jgi:predicted transposase/invertase (TIGR01784 family)
MVQEKDDKTIININNTNINDISDKYDVTLKEVFDDEIFIKELILYFVAQEWVKNIDFKTLKREKTDFLTEDLKVFRKDLLWSVKLASQKVYFFIHIEFQSTPDRRMPFRFLNYN